MRLGLPVLHFRGVVPGVHGAWGAVVVDAGPPTFTAELLSVGGVAEVLASVTSYQEATELLRSGVVRRRHTLALVLHRLHQAGLRERMLRAYRRRCTVWGLPPPELVDPAHIRPDAGGGRPVISKGLAMGKIHHAAFDEGIPAMHPRKLAVVARDDVMVDDDGPMLRHGLQGADGEPIHLAERPDWPPDREALEERFERSLQAS